MMQLALIRHVSLQIMDSTPEYWPLSKQGQRRVAVLVPRDLWRTDYFTIPEGSSGDWRPIAQAAARMTRCLQELVAMHPGQALVAVSYGLGLPLLWCGPV